MAKKTVARRWRETWQALSRPNKITFVLSVIAITFTLVNLVTDLIQNKQQNGLSREMFLFQIEAQATADAQTQKQIDIQNTQTALNTKLESIARLQAFPLMVVVSPEKLVFVVTQISNSNNNILLVVGRIETILANNGGVRAGLVSIDWVNDIHQSNDLLKVTTDQVYIGNNITNLPTSIEGQTPVKFVIRMNGELKQPKISDDEVNFGNKDYQLQEFIVNALYMPGTEVDFNFSNTDTLAIPLSKIVFEINEFNPQDPSAFYPSPPSFLDMLSAFFRRGATYKTLEIVVVLAGLFISIKYILDRNNKIYGSLIFMDINGNTIAEFGLYNGTNVRNIKRRELYSYPQLELQGIKLKNIVKRDSKSRRMDELGSEYLSKEEITIRAECVSVTGRRFSVELYPNVPDRYSPETDAEMMYEPNE